jgi:F0F1-type ATP synthase alpha subunit
VATLLAYKLDVFENVPVKKVKSTAKELLGELYKTCGDFVTEINETGKLTDDVEEQMKLFMLNFKENLK